MTEEELKKKKEVRERIRIVTGDLTSDEVVTKCKTILKEKDHVVLDEMFPDTRQENLDSATLSITSDNKFMVDATPFKKNWVVKRNPAYRDEFRHDVKLAVITGVITLLIGIALWLVDRQSKNQEIQQLKERVDEVSDRLNRQSP